MAERETSVGAWRGKRRRRSKPSDTKTRQGKSEYLSQAKKKREALMGGAGGKGKNEDGLRQGIIFTASSRKVVGGEKRGVQEETRVQGRQKKF